MKQARGMGGEYGDGGYNKTEQQKEKQTDADRNQENTGKIHSETMLDTLGESSWLLLMSLWMIRFVSLT